MDIVKRFLQYVSFDTQSDEKSETCPSTDKQKALGAFLVEEMKALGLSGVEMDEHGYVYATLEKNIPKDGPILGLIAHMDTSPDFTGKDVRPVIVENYDGEDLMLNEDKGIVMAVKDFPNLKNYEGQTLITTDGTTLLGADDKAGIAAILDALENLLVSGEPHGTVKVAFTPDEEIGRGADHFDVEKFGADFAYTIDGGEIGEINYENFNAAGAKVSVNGVNIHTGSAKNKMKNAVLIGMEFNGLLPVTEVPSATEMREGFYHLNNFNGSVERTDMVYILRDHDRERFEQRKNMMEHAAAFINGKYGAGTIELNLTDTYYNMLEKFSGENMKIIEIALEAMDRSSVEPIILPIRGGTDGSRLSFMGLPTPNLFTGGFNYHGKFECIPVESLVKSSEVIQNIIRLVAD